MVLMRGSNIRSALRKGYRFRSSHGFGFVRSETLTEKFVEHFGACLRALAERNGRPRSEASCCLSQKCSKSATAPRAAEKASPALTCDFGAVCEPPVGSKTRTTASQNVIRSRNHIA